MKPKKIYWKPAVFSLALLATWNLAQAESLVVPAEQCVCNHETEDKLEEPSKFNFGTYFGQCVDSCRYRRSNFLSTDGVVTEKDGEASLLVSNFMHEEKYWKAKIPLDRVESAEVGFEEFMPGVFHVLLVFHFPPTSPVLLYSQEKADSAPKIIYDMALSPEGIPPKQGKYNLFDAYMEHYLIGIRLFSKDEVVNWSIKKLKHKVSLYTLQMSQSQVREVLRAGLFSGEKTSFRAKYGLFSNNCATSTLDLIDSVVKPDVSGFPIYYGLLYGLERSLPVAGPFGTLHVFRSRDLIRESAKSIL